MSNVRFISRICAMIFIEIMICLFMTHAHGQTRPFSARDKTIKLDTRHVTGDIFRALQCTNENGVRRIYLQTLAHDVIHIYTEENDEFLYDREIKFDREGPNGTRTQTKGFYVLNRDTILVFSMNRFIHYFDSKGNKYDEFSKDPFINNFSVNGVPEMFGSFPFTHINSTVFGTTGGAAFEFDLLEVGFSFDAARKKFDWLIDPQDHVKGYWGESSPSFFSYAVANSTTGQILVSLPHHHNLIELNEKGEIIGERETKFFKIGKLKPLSKKKERYSEIRQQAHFASQGFYMEILHDPFSSKYYRMAYAPVLDFVTLHDAYIYPHVMIFDEQFNLEKEIAIPMKYKSCFNFISEDGLCFFNEDLFEEAEYDFVFDCFKL